MLLWVKNAPSISQSFCEDAAALIDQYVACTVPQQYNHLACLIQSVQRQIRSFSCKTHGTRCIFSFPKPPVRKTTVVLPPENIPNKRKQTIYTEMLRAVMGKLEDVQHDPEVTLEA